MSLVVIPSEQESASQFFNTINNIVDRKEKRQERMVEIMRQTGDYKGLEKEGVRTKIDNPLYVDPGPMPDQQKDPKGYDAWLKRVQTAGPKEIEGDFRRQSATLYEMGYSQIRQAMAEGRLDDARMIRDKTADAIAQSATLWRTKPSDNLMDSLLKVAPKGPAGVVVNYGTDADGRMDTVTITAPVGSRQAVDQINAHRKDRGLPPVDPSAMIMSLAGKEGSQNYEESVNRRADVVKNIEAGANSKDKAVRFKAQQDAKRLGIKLKDESIFGILPEYKAQNTGKRSLADLGN